MRTLANALVAFGALTAATSADAQSPIARGVVTGPHQAASPQGGHQIISRSQSMGPVVADHGHHHHGGGGLDGIRGGYGGAYWSGYGFPNYGFSGFSYGTPGYGLNYYTGPANWGPLINPPIYAFGPYSSWPGYGPVGYGYGGYGYGFGPTFGYGTAYPGYYANPFNNQYLQQQYNNDWTMLSARLADLATRNVAEPTTGATAVPIPSTPELMIKSLRFQAQGDEAFRKQDFQRAYDRYKQATLTAKDNGAAQMRMGYTLVALGQYPRAIEYFKRGLSIDPALAITGPSPSDLYGDNNLAWSSHLSKVTEWVREDIRDYNRVFLLGVLLYFDGDTRARELLEKAYQLSGGRETAVVTLLNPPKVETKTVTPSEDQTAPAEGAAPTTNEEGPSLAAPSDKAEPLIPEPPSAEEVPATRPPGQEPLFPLPSQRKNDSPDVSAPPLPAPADDSASSQP